MSQRPAKSLADFTRFIKCDKLISRWAKLNSWHTGNRKAKEDFLEKMTKLDENYDGSYVSKYDTRIRLRPPKYIRNDYNLPKCVGLDGKLIPYDRKPSCEECNRMALDAYPGYNYRVNNWRRTIFMRCRSFLKFRSRE